MSSTISTTGIIISLELISASTQAVPVVLFQGMEPKFTYLFLVILAIITGFGVVRGLGREVIEKIVEVFFFDAVLYCPFILNGLRYFRFWYWC